MHDSLTERLGRVTLRTKITGVTVLLLTLGLLVSGIGTMVMVKEYAIRQVDAKVKAIADTTKNPCTDEDVRMDGGDYYMALFDGNGEFQCSNWVDRPRDEIPVADLPLTTLAVNANAGAASTLHDRNGGSYRAVPVTVTINSQGTNGTLVVAYSLKPTENQMATYLTIFFGFGIGVVLVGAGLTRLLVATTFLPLREVERTAAAIADGDFSQRLGGATPNTEVGRLNRSLNTMLNRIDRAFKDRARTIDQMRRFVGDASHELRTPLVSVRGYAELYRMGALQTPEEIGQAMERIEKEAIRMGGLVEDLLELARLDETKPLAVAPVDLVPLARDAALDAMASSPGRTVTVLTPVPIEDIDTAPMDPVDLGHSTGDLTRAAAAAVATDADDDAPAASGAADRRGPKANDRTHPSAAPTGPISFAGATLARLRTRRPRRTDASAIPGTPTAGPAALVASQQPAAIPAVVMAEENKIRQVITNLMGNAMRFTGPEIPIELEVTVDRRNQRASVAIIDHGEGIPPQIREKIFQRFWRADSSRARETGGSGLGLAIVASIVASHNGTVDVVETPGGGATFRVWFPLATSSSAPQQLTGRVEPRVDSA
nr:HAMP domain-containing sensor histidine kinase [Glaciibacter superstes]